jgi:Mrp family chromosome partitioning ATPase
MTEKNDNCETCSERGTCPSQNSAEAVTCEVDQGSRIKHKIIIASGKGGVGKSTVSVNLARALLLDGFKVGILDADITGPNIPKLLGIEDRSLVLGEEGIRPADAGGIKAASMALVLSSPDSPVVWRGPMKMAAIKQFIQDVD